jgi:hypothetical protein
MEQVRMSIKKKCECKANEYRYEEHAPEWQMNYLEELKKEKVASNGEEMQILQLNPDIYCLTFLKFIQLDNPKMHRNLMLKSVLAFVVQVLLCALVMSETKGWSDIFTGRSELNGSRLVCSFLLHISIMPEIRNSLDMIRYTLNNKHAFKGHGYYLSFLILMMRLTGNFFTELLNIWKLG